MPEALVVDTIPHQCERCAPLEREIHLLRLEVNRLRASNKAIWAACAAFSKASKKAKRK